MYIYHLFICICKKGNISSAWKWEGLRTGSPQSGHHQPHEPSFNGHYSKWGFTSYSTCHSHDDLLLFPQLWYYHPRVSPLRMRYLVVYARSLRSFRNPGLKSNKWTESARIRLIQLTHNISQRHGIYTAYITYISFNSYAFPQRHHPSLSQCTEGTGKANGRSSRIRKR